MKLLSIICLTLLIVFSAAFTSDVVYLGDTNLKDACGGFAFSCKASAKETDATQATFSWEIKHGSTQATLDITQVNNAVKLNVSTASVFQEYVIIKPGVLSAGNLNVKCTIQQTDSATPPANKGSATDSTFTAITLTKDTCGTGPIIQLTQAKPSTTCNKIVSINGGVSTTDRITFVGVGITGKTDDSALGSLTLNELTSTKIGYILAYSAANKTQTFLQLTYTTDECTYYANTSATTDNCNSFVQTYTFPKESTWVSHVATVLINNGTKDLTENTDYNFVSYVSGSNIIVNVVVYPKKLAKTLTGTFTVTLVQKDASKTIGNVLASKSTLVSGAADCAKDGIPMTAAYNDDCTKFTISSSQSKTWLYYGPTLTQTLTDIKSLDIANPTTMNGFYLFNDSTNGSEYYYGKAQSECVKVKETTAKDICGDMVYTCYNSNYANAAAATYTWTAGSLTAAQVVSAPATTKLSATGTIAKNTITTLPSPATIDVKCSVKLDQATAVVSEKVTTTLVNTSCSGGNDAGAGDDDDDDSSSILSMLVLVLLIIVL